jgi:hypothetical protein
VFLVGGLMATAEERLRAYRICQERGHTPSNLVLQCNPPLNVCKFCGTNYRFTAPELVETNPPTEDEDE